MEIKRVWIQNYRSIKDENIYFTPSLSCRILVGINESGKSNILNALSLLSEEYEISAEDERELLANEAEDENEYKIIFVFDLTKDLDAIYQKEVITMILGSVNSKIFKKGENTYTIKQYCEKFFKEGLYCIDLSNNSRDGSSWTIDNSGYEIIAGWKKPSDKCPGNFTFTDEDEETCILSDYTLVRPKDEWSIPKEYLSDITVKDVEEFIAKIITDFVVNNLPSVVYWKYSENQLLPEKVNLTSFINNPDDYMPLKNMFHLTGYDDIKTSVKKAKEKGDTQLNNLLKRVAQNSTEYFQSVWKEYRDIKFSLRMNGEFIQCSVTEQNDYAFNKRSDGFKRFIAFLLTVSSIASTGKLKNSLLLIDEPDAGLHPSGARYLRDELIKISKDNYVVFSTHSIFMIDKNNIGRHLIVTKDKEITKINEANEGNLVNEEVILGSLGYSVFEHLKPMNIICEGWRDKKLMQTAMKSYDNKNFFKNIGIVNVDGVKSMTYFIPMLELAERKGVIISDSDEPAKKKQKEYSKLNYKIEWNRYDEISDITKARTGEDFLKAEYFFEELKSVLHKNSITMEIKESDLPSYDRLSYLKQQLHKISTKEDTIKIIQDELKEILFNKLTRTGIDDSYFIFLDKLKQHLNTLI